MTLLLSTVFAALCQLAWCNSCSRAAGVCQQTDRSAAPSLLQVLQVMDSVNMREPIEPDSAPDLTTSARDAKHTEHGVSDAGTAEEWVTGDEVGGTDAELVKAGLDPDDGTDWDKLAAEDAARIPSSLKTDGISEGGLSPRHFEDLNDDADDVETAVASPVDLMSLNLTAGMELEFVKPTTMQKGNCVRLWSRNFRDRAMRHAGFVMWNHPIADQIAKLDSSFYVRPGLASSNSEWISLESKNYPAHYVRHKGYRVQISRYDGSSLFKSDATWRVTSPLDEHSAGHISLESFNQRNHFIRHRGYQLWLDRKQGSGLYKVDASWKPAMAEDHVVSWTMYAHELLRATTGSYRFEDAVKVGYTHEVATDQQISWHAKANMNGLIKAFQVEMEAEVGERYSQQVKVATSRETSRTQEVSCPVGSTPCYLYQMEIAGWDNLNRPVHWKGSLIQTHEPIRARVTQTFER